MPVLNIPYTKYDPATGRILQTGNMHTTDFPVHTGAGSAMMSGHGNALTQYVVDQSLVERPTLTLPATIADLGVDANRRPPAVPRNTRSSRGGETSSSLGSQRWPPSPAMLRT